ncbi:MAG: efflux RND transporter periplasmic adaptor subunit [Polyangiales bacterium]
MTIATAPRPTPRAAADPSGVRKALAREEGGRKWLVRLVVLLVLGAAIFGVIRWRQLHPTAKPPRFMTEEATTGDVIETIQSTGTVQPVNQVQVGAQVSGRIAKRYVDFNSKVKKGDLLAELDPTLYQAGVSRDRAGVTTALSQIEGAKAQVALAKSNYDRAELLHGQGLLGEADLTTAKGNHASAVAQLHGAEAGLITASAALKNSQTSLSYTKIYAPIDGVVVARSIDEGQTVAASFQAPVLFTIAQDLSQMNVLADIDEADLGRLSVAKEPEVDVQVSAFPGEVFKGKLVDVRFNATTTQGVVTYPAVIQVDNPDIKLRPGMTATVSIRTAQTKGATRIPNSALRFKPIPPMGADGKPRPVTPEPPLAKGKGRVYLAPAAPDGEATAAVIDIGISDGLFTVVEGGLKPGAKVVVDESDPDADKKKQKSPF